MATSNMIYVGIGGAVVALDRATGSELWRTQLKGSDFVNVAIDGDQLYAGVKGELFCLDQSTGMPRWHNKLKGLGWGLLTIASRGDASSGQTTPVAEKRRRDQQAAAAITTT